MTKRICLYIALLASSLLTGCLGYQLGGGRPAGIETVALAPVLNQTTEPAVELQITHALRERIQFDGRLKLVDMADSPDGLIEVTLTNYDLAPIAYGDQDRTTPAIYRLRITGRAALKRADTGSTVSSSNSYGESTLPYKSDLTTAKRDALPAAAGEFAKYMVDDLIEQW